MTIIMITIGLRIRRACDVKLGSSSCQDLVYRYDVDIRVRVGLPGWAKTLNPKPLKP